MKKLKAVYLFPNGNIAVFDTSGQQVPELQGEYSLEKHRRILLQADNSTTFEGFEHLPAGFVESAKKWAEYFKKQNLTWEQIESLIKE